MLYLRQACISCARSATQSLTPHTLTLEQVPVQAALRHELVHQQQLLAVRRVADEIHEVRMAQATKALELSLQGGGGSVGVSSIRTVFLESLNAAFQPSLRRVAAQHSPPRVCYRMFPSSNRVSKSSSQAASRSTRHHIPSHTIKLLHHTACNVVPLLITFIHAE